MGEDQLSHSHITTGKIIFSYISMLRILERIGKPEMLN
jgi:hypothetical protein